MTPIAPRFGAAPGSTALRFHHAFDGGLLSHSFEVLRIMLSTAQALGADTLDTMTGLSGWRFTPSMTSFVPACDVLTAALLHDMNKIGDVFGNLHYVPNMIKNGTVRSEKIPYVTNDGENQFSCQITPNSTSIGIASHTLAELAPDFVPEGELSLALVRALSPDKLWPTLSARVKVAIRFHDGAYGRGRRLLSGNETPLQMLLHYADMWSSRLNCEDYRG